MPDSKIVSKVRKHRHYYRIIWDKDNFGNKVIKGAQCRCGVILKQSKEQCEK